MENALVCVISVSDSVILYYHSVSLGPDGLWIIGLPGGPTAHFRMASVRYRREVPVCIFLLFSFSSHFCLDARITYSTLPGTELAWLHYASRTSNEPIFRFTVSIEAKPPRATDSDIPQSERLDLLPKVPLHLRQPNHTSSTRTGTTFLDVHAITAGRML